MLLSYKMLEVKNHYLQVAYPLGLNPPQSYHQNVETWSKFIFFHLHLFSLAIVILFPYSYLPFSHFSSSHLENYILSLSSFFWFQSLCIKRSKSQTTSHQLKELRSEVVCQAHILVHTQSTCNGPKLCNFLPRDFSDC